MRKKLTKKRPYFKMESAMTAILRDVSGKMHHGILFDPPLVRDGRKRKNSKTLIMPAHCFIGLMKRREYSG